jgi:hypothetical protein
VHSVGGGAVPALAHSLTHSLGHCTGSHDLARDTSTVTLTHSLTHSLTHRSGRVGSWRVMVGQSGCREVCSVASE